MKAGGDFATRHLALALNTQGIPLRNMFYQALTGAPSAALCDIGPWRPSKVFCHTGRVGPTGPGLKYVGSSWVIGICLCREAVGIGTF